MANTTNFGWETPDDTDLVKDGAAAIRTLGSAIDTSLVDLKGGTTGQVLAKASDTDLDFTWASDASGIPATIFDAKGDLIAASAADTAARLPVGTNGQYLSANSSTSTGLEWVSLSAGGLTLISTTTLSNTTTTISSIPTTYKGLLINVLSPTVSAATRIDVQTNSNNQFTGSTLASKTTWDNMANDPLKITANASLSTTSPNMSTTIWIPNYAETTAYKTVIFFGGYNKSASGQEAAFGIGQLTTNSEITSLTFLTANGTSTMTGTVKLYGVN